MSRLKGSIGGGLMSAVDWVRRGDRRVRILLVWYLYVALPQWHTHNPPIFVQCSYYFNYLTYSKLRCLQSFMRDQIYRLFVLCVTLC